MTSCTWIFRALPAFHNSCELDIIFLGSHKKVFLVLLHIRLITSVYSAWKILKKDAIMFKLFWYKVFIHCKLKLLNFLMDSVLSSIHFANLMHWVSEIRLCQETLDCATAIFSCYWNEMILSYLLKLTSFSSEKYSSLSSKGSFVAPWNIKANSRPIPVKIIVITCRKRNTNDVISALPITAVLNLNTRS